MLYAQKFYTPLTTLAETKKPLLSSQEIRSVFSNVAAILQINTMLLEALATRKPYSKKHNKNKKQNKTKHACFFSVSLHKHIYEHTQTHPQTHTLTHTQTRS